MKKISCLWCFCLLIIIESFAQQYNPDSLIQLLKGTWEWEYYYGGFAGLPQTPSNRNVRIEFYQNAQDAGTITIRYRVFENDTLEYDEPAYMIYNENDFFSPYRLSSNALYFVVSINFLEPFQNSFKLFGDTLELTLSEVADAFNYGFKKKVFSSNNNIKQNLSNISFYPNPVENNLTINQNDFSASFITAYDVNGKILFQLLEPKEKIIQLDFSDMFSGVYFIELLSENNTLKKTIIKK